MYIHYMCIHYI